MRVVFVSAVLALGVWNPAVAGKVSAAVQQYTHIESQPLGQALKKLASQRGFQVLYLSSVVGDARTPGVNGSLTTAEALAGLLSGTGFSYKYVDEKTVTIYRDAAGPAPSSSSPAAPASQSRDQGNTNVPGDPADNGLLPAQADQRKNSASMHAQDPRSPSNSRRAYPESGASSGPSELGEVVVTAQKRQERLQDVPVAVSVLETDALAANNQLRIQDYYAQIPGMSLSSNANFGGTQFITLRGLSTTAYSNPSVAFVIDDIPFGSSLGWNFGGVTYPDIDPSDLDHIEVLRGPQGTLYGADSLGGVVKVVTRDPSTEGISGRVQVSAGTVDHGGNGYGVHAAVNLPVNDVLAVRLSGFTRRDAGYVDNVTTGQQDVDRAQYHGGMGSVLWAPSENLSVKFNVMLQSGVGTGSAEVNADENLKPTIGDYSQTGMRGVNSYTNSLKVYSLRVLGKIGDADLTSLTAYNTNRYWALYDFSQLFGSFSQSMYGVSGSPLRNLYLTKKFSQEVRLTSPQDQKLEWMIGGFYTHEDDGASYQNFYAADILSGANAGPLADNLYTPNTMAERAIFGNVTWHFTDALDLQLGARESSNRQALGSTSFGPLDDPYTQVTPTIRAEGNAFTYLITPRFKITPDMMFYARFSTGYRVGGTNLAYMPGNGVPEQFDPDRTTNYEFGFKGDLFDRMLTLDAALYYVDWRKMQITEIYKANNISYTANGGKATSQGLELSAQWRPWQGTTVSLVTAFNDAELAEDLPSSSTAYGLKGDQLPYSSKFSGSLRIEQKFSLAGGWEGALNASVSHVGVRYAEFGGTFTDTRLRYPGYSFVDTNFSVMRGPWDINLYINNLTDSRGVLGGGPAINYDNPTQHFVSYMQPRTIGVSASYSF
ncbi:MAG: TonB-dependent receptor [Rudaea sp.]|uniref:TonB-dependent receptor domain-containing protein n=1 Tax=Rudaea sp. TaxID=2136325 RepID=UPI0039E5BA13